VGEWAELSGNYTYTQATFRAGPNAGNVIPLVPAHQAKVEALINLPLGFSLGSSGQYIGPAYAGGDFDNNMTMLEGYFLWNAFLRYKPTYIPGKLELYVGVDNLLNNTTQATTGFDWGTMVVYYPGQGRSWRIGGSYRY
jgi:outer membrane receptor for monomeric catechols